MEIIIIKSSSKGFDFNENNLIKTYVLGANHGHLQALGLKQLLISIIFPKVDPFSRFNNHFLPELYFHLHLRQF